MLEIHGVQRAFDGVPVLQGIDLTISDGEIVCLLGPSGCGKTTLLRIVSGLEKADNGSILLDNQNIQSIPTHQRGFGLMFQDFALFPHMNVSANVTFGLQMQNLPISDQQVRVRKMLDLVGLSGFDQRDVTHLSGGERQRVALARSLAPNPRLLMLDEPLGSLDTALREGLIIELRSIIKQLHLTTIYVTHDQHEAFAIADRIAVMNAGHIEQFAAPTELYQRPSSAFVAHFLGLDNILPILSQQNGIATTQIGDFPVSEPAQSLLLHTDFVKVVPADTPDSISALIAQSVFQGDTYRLTLRHSSGTALTVKYPAANMPAPQIGDTVAIQIAPNAIISLQISQGDIQEHLTSLPDLFLSPSFSEDAFATNNSSAVDVLPVSEDVHNAVAGLLDSFLSPTFPEAALMVDDSSSLDALSISLIEIGKDDVNQILERFHENPSRLTYILGQIGDPRAVKPLLERLRESPNDTATVYALGEIGDPRAIDPLVQLLKDPRSKGVTSRIIEALGTINDPRARQALEKLSRDTAMTESVRNEAIKLLSRFPIGTERAFRARERAKRRKM